MDRDLELSEAFDVKPSELYEDWLSSSAHSAFTGSPAVIDPKPGGKFTAWDGYIQGSTKEVESGKRILQLWRTIEFPDDAPDSLLEIIFEPEGNGTKVTLRHTRIPDGQAEGYEVGWRDWYFKPMKEYYK